MAYSSAQQTRDWQVSELRKAFPQVVEAQTGTLFDLPCHTPDALFNVRVALRPSFPVEAPQIELMPAAEHPWLNAYSYVVGAPAGHPALGRAWVSMTNLGGVVADLMREFAARPPRRKPAAAAPGGYPGAYMAGADARGGAAPGAPAPYGTAGGAPGPYGPAGGYSAAGVATHVSGYPPGPHHGHAGASSGGVPPPHGPLASQPPPSLSAGSSSVMPAIPSSFPELATLSVEELDQLLMSDAVFEDFFASLAFVKSYRAFRVQFKARNAELAARVLAQREAMAAQQAELQRAHTELEAARGALAEKAARQQLVLQRYAPEALAAKLEAATAQADQESTELEHAFVSGRATDTATFIRDFIALRKVVHSRHAKAERLRASARRR